MQIIMVIYLLIHPQTLYNFNIDDSFLKTGIFEFELLYDIGRCILMKATAK
jgi:hypothetical protein